MRIIDTYAFSRCTGSCELVVPPSVTTIGNWAFAECGDLERVVLPVSDSAIKEGILMDCTIRHAFVPFGFASALVLQANVGGISCPDLRWGPASL